MFRHRNSLAAILQSALRGSRPRTFRKSNPLRLEPLESREVPALFTVNNPLDDGSANTLRWAIDQANAEPGHDTIDFAIGGSGVHTIQPLSPLPWITEAVTIDGYTQAGSKANTLTVGSDAVLNIEIDGSASGGSGLIITADGTTVKGLAINNFPGYGVFLFYGDSNVIAGNFIGTDPSGTIARPNDWGIKISSGANNVIGGPNAADRNVVSGNKYDGINLQGTYNPSDFQNIGNSVRNNYAGTNAAGTTALPNGSPTSDGYGISVGGGSGNFVIGNLISGNSDGGLVLGDWNSTVQGNRIGTDAAGTGAIPNTGNLFFPMYGNGIYAYGTNNAIEDNLIAFNDGAGIYVTVHTASYGDTSTAIRGNSIHSNGGLGIDLAPEAVSARGPNANDSSDADAGPNGYQNFPLIATASSGGSGTVVAGTLNSTEDTAFTLDFYASPAADASGYGEGKLYLGSTSVTTDGSGNAAFNAAVAGVAPLGWFVSATATGPAGTSEFSTTATVDSGGCVVNTNDSGPGSLRQAILNANANPGPDTIRFDMYADDPNHVYYADDGVAGQVSAANITVTTATSDSLIANLDPDHPHSWWSIQPTSVLPTMTGTTIIDGYTQRGSSANTLLGGLNTVLRIELNGSQAGTGSTGGLYFDRSDSTLRGLSVNSYWQGQVNVGTGSTATNFALEGSFIGVDPSGLRAGTSQGRGVHIFVDLDGRIGTNADGVNDLAERNLISGGSFGIDFHGGSGYLAAGNLIGTDITGTRAIPNLHGIVSQHNGVTIGGTAEVARNVISGNTGTGILLNLTESTGNVIQGNYIGVDVTGTQALGNNAGIGMGSNRTSDLLIGGTTPEARNIISGNRGAGIILGTNSNATVQGNYIGTDVTGTLDIGNRLMGILLNLGSVNNQIGGFAPGAGNLIAYNGPGTLSTDGDGIRINVNSGHATNSRIEGNTIIGNSVSGVRVSAGTDTIIRGNSIHGNGGLGIDLQAGAAAGGVTANDTDDADTGPNGYQNFPLLAAASSSAGGTVVTGTLNSTGSTAFTLDFYASPAADPSGHGEGMLHLGSVPVTTDGGGDVSFTATVSGVAPVGWFLSATATGPEGTSEFSGKTTVAAGNIAPTDLVLNTGGIFEHDVFTLTGSFTDDDAHDTHTVTVNWGDGSPAEAFTLPVGERSFAFDHRYLDDNPTATGADDYHPTVIVSDGSLDAEADTTVRVTNLAPSNLQWTLSDHDIAENGTTTIHVTFDDPGTRDSHRVTIDWGDGAVETYTVAYTERSFSHTHTYRDDNPTLTPRDSYVVGVNLVDDDGGIATAATTVIYGLKSQGGSSSSPPTALYSFNSDGSGFTDIGRVEIEGLSIDADALAYSPTAGMFAYQMLEPDSVLISINPDNAEATLIGSPLTGREIRAAAFDHEDRLWVLDSIGNALLEINPANGQITGSPLGLTRNGTPHNLSTAIDLAVRNDGTMVVVDYNNATLIYSLDLTTGALNLLKSDAVPQADGSRVASAGLAFPSWHADELFTYDVNGQDDIYRYDVSAGYQRNAFLPHFLPSFNSGRGDLASAAGNTRVFVNNLDPVIDTFTATSDYGTGVVHVSGSYHDVGSLDTHTLVINWGDGSEEPVSLSGPHFTAAHTYADPGFDPLGKFTITATLRDDDSGIATKVASFTGATIAGVKFRDVNKDGAKAPTDNVMNGWIVYIDDDNDGVRDSGERYAVTIGHGNYTFENLAPGTYRIREDGVPGWTQTTAPWDITIGSGQLFDEADIGNYREAVIRGVKFDDFNGDGVRQSGEIGLEGWTIFLDENENSVLDSGEPFTITGSFGEYAFDPVPAGVYHIREVQQPGWMQTTGDATFTVAPDASSQVFTSDFGNFRLGAITGGQMFEDENGNGIRDDGEPGLGDRIVFIDDDNDGVRDPGEAFRITDPDGTYDFGLLPIGDYRIRLEVPSGWEPTTDPIDVSITESGQTLPGGTIGITLQPTSLSGFVWLDADDDGLIDATEQGVGGVRIELSGVNDRGETVSRSTTTDTDGQYLFDSMRPGTYAIREIQPSTLVDGRDAVGSLGGTLANDFISGVYVDAGQSGIQYNFGERAPSSGYVHKGQAATIGFWQNKNGQTLIKSLNGGPNATALGNWLASEFPNLYGAAAGASNLAGKTNSQIAAHYITLFKVKGQKLDAQVLAVAFAVYVTNSGLAGTTAAAYGFEVTSTGTGLATYNVGSSGAAFGVANNTTLTVMDILRVTNARSTGGVLYNGNTSLRNLANTVYDGINNEGDIG